MYRNNSYPQNIQNQYGNSMLPEHLESLLNRNNGKKVKIYMSFPDSVEWRDKIFSGILEGSGSSYILLRNNNTPMLLQKIYINFIEFEENINY